MDYDSCLKRGTMLGSGGIIVMNETTSIPRGRAAGHPLLRPRVVRPVHALPRRDRTPSRRCSRGIVAGHGTQRGHRPGPASCARTIKGSTLCPTGEAFAMPIEAMVTKFRAEFEALIR